MQFFFILELYIYIDVCVVCAYIIFCMSVYIYPIFI